MATIGQIATHIYTNEFDDLPTGQTGARIQGISGWLQSNVGQLNNVIYSSFSSGVTQEFQLEEENVFTQLYLRDYYTRQSRVVLNMGITGNMTDWTRLTEGDTTIVRTNRVDMGRTYRLLAQDASKELKDLIYAYNSYQAMPRQVAGFDGGFVSGSGLYRYPPWP